MLVVSWLVNQPVSVCLCMSICLKCLCILQFIYQYVWPEEGGSLVFALLMCVSRRDRTQVSWCFDQDPAIE